MTQMPYAPTQPPPSDTASQPQYVITEADKKRIRRVQHAWKAYEGELDRPLVPMDDEPDDNVLTNRMQAVVDRGGDFLFGKELEITVEEGAPQETQDFLNDAWGDKETRVPLLFKLEMNGANAGTGFLRVIKHKDGSLRVIEVDPAIVYVQWMPQDCQTVTLYCLEYCEEKPSQKSIPDRIYTREEISLVDPDGMYNPKRWFKSGANAGVSWQIQHWTRIGERGNWTPAGEPIAWPHPFPPIFACQNLPKPNDFWGYPDITPDLIGVNVALNLLQSNINRSEKIYGNPVLWAKGMGDSITDIKPGKVTGLPPDGEMGAVTITTDVANGLQFAANLRSDIDEQSSVPGVATGRISDLPRGQMSGVAIELLFMPLLKKTDKKRCLYGALIIEVSKALLVLNGMSGDIKITLNWQNPLPTDDLQSVQAAVAKQAVGISNTTLQRELGYDPDEQADLNDAEDERKVTAFSRGQGMPPAPPQMPQPPQQSESGEPEPASPFIGR